MESRGPMHYAAMAPIEACAAYYRYPRWLSWARVVVPRHPGVFGCRGQSYRRYRGGHPTSLHGRNEGRSVIGVPTGAAGWALGVPFSRPKVSGALHVQEVGTKQTKIRRGVVIVTDGTDGYVCFLVRWARLFCFTHPYLPVACEIRQPETEEANRPNRRKDRTYNSANFEPWAKELGKYLDDASQGPSPASSRGSPRIRRCRGVRRRSRPRTSARRAEGAIRNRTEHGAAKEQRERHHRPGQLNGQTKLN